jgi:phosphatidylglycerophosphatase A
VTPQSRLGLPRWHPAVVLASWFGAGFLPLAPGSWGSLAALPFAWALTAACGKLGLAIALLCLLPAGAWAAQAVVRHSGRHDPGAIVVDEVAGQWLVLLAAPRALPFYAAGFVLFRIFDVAKPWPAGWADRRVGGGVGVMLDDVFAAVYAGVVLLAIDGAAGVRP